MFTIHFGADAAHELEPPQPGAQYGTIVLGEQRETFVSVQTYWDAARYEMHWREAVARVARDGLDSCLITSLADPRASHMLFWWPLYRDGDAVIAQNAILLFDELAEPFDPEQPFRSVPRRTTTNEDGQPISEWRVPLADFEAFARIGV